MRARPRQEGGPQVSVHTQAAADASLRPPPPSEQEGGPGGQSRATKHGCPRRADLGWGVETPTQGLPESSGSTVLSPEPGRRGRGETRRQRRKRASDGGRPGSHRHPELTPKKSRPLRGRVGCRGRVCTPRESRAEEERAGRARQWPHPQPQLPSEPWQSDVSHGTRGRSCCSVPTGPSPPALPVSSRGTRTRPTRGPAWTRVTRRRVRHGPEQRPPGQGSRER